MWTPETWHAWEGKSTNPLFQEVPGMSVLQVCCDYMHSKYLERTWWSLTRLTMFVRKSGGPKLRGKAAEIRHFAEVLLSLWQSHCDNTQLVHRQITLLLKKNVMMERLMTEHHDKLFFEDDEARAFEQACSDMLLLHADLAKYYAGLGKQYFFLDEQDTHVTTCSPTVGSGSPGRQSLQRLQALCLECHYAKTLLEGSHATSLESRFCRHVFESYACSPAAAARVRAGEVQFREGQACGPPPYIGLGWYGKPAVAFMLGARPTWRRTCSSGCGHAPGTSSSGRGAPSVRAAARWTGYAARRGAVGRRRGALHEPPNALPVVRQLPAVQDAFAGVPVLRSLKDSQLLHDLAGGCVHELTDNQRSDETIFRFLHWLRVDEPEQGAAAGGRGMAIKDRENRRLAPEGALLVEHRAQGARGSWARAATMGEPRSSATPSRTPRVGEGVATSAELLSVI
ncbi:pfh1 [Symbiodinium natans]|uniref:Pfh1 protein n=1 Tax=Symbiodinium natans TaxID=878477 RepID=A0A812UCZ6_9DINO|nr:pfh1 [Symbiodinium natans]